MSLFRRSKRENLRVPAAMMIECSFLGREVSSKVDGSAQVNLSLSRHCPQHMLVMRRH
jgi:hypothetical protein